MRLLIVWPDADSALDLLLMMEQQGWEVDLLTDGRQALRCEKAYDLWLIHLCLPGMDGCSLGCALEKRQILCPPRVVLARPSALCAHAPSWADCTVEAGVHAEKLCRLLLTVAQKPLPKLAAVHQPSIALAVEQFFHSLRLKKNLKGRTYLAWMLGRLIPCPSADEHLFGTLYADCAKQFGVSAASVERCVRIAVENIFTQGNLQSIEQFFGATVDPERGKPTNRAFVLQAAEMLRAGLNQSRTAARSPNSSEMHHRPAAPTSV